MKHMKVDGRDLMLNELETLYWLKTGDFKRLTEGDDSDTDYIGMRDKMIENGDEDYYKSCCPPEGTTEPHNL